MRRSSAYIHKVISATAFKQVLENDEGSVPSDFVSVMNHVRLEVPTFQVLALSPSGRDGRSRLFVCAKPWPR